MTKSAEKLAIIKDAHGQIVDDRLNQVRCLLTGAPYAKINSQEIATTLAMMIDSMPQLNADGLVDQWALKMLTYSTRMSPVFIGQTDFALKQVAEIPMTGNIRVVTYLLGALFYPKTNTTGLAASRLMFVSSIYDTLADEQKKAVEEDRVVAFNDTIAMWVQYLSAADGWCRLTAWQDITYFTASRSSEGLNARKNKTIKVWFKQPDSFEPTKDNMRILIRFVMRVMAEVAELDHELPAQGNPQSRKIFDVVSDSIQITNTENKSKRKTKRLSAAERQVEIEREREARRKEERLNSDKRVRFAWSATHGAGVAPGDKMPKKTGGTTGGMTKSRKPAKKDQGKIDQLSAAMKDMGFDF